MKQKKEGHTANHGRGSKSYAQNSSYANQKHQQDVLSSLELSHIQNQNFIGKQVKQDIENDYERAEELNNSRNGQIKVGNTYKEESFAEVDYEANKDGSYSQLWRQS